MSTKERRDEIIRILLGRRRETMPHLAAELGVSVKTIQRDILVLTVDEQYPIDTEQGHGGGVVMREFRHPHKHILSQEQIRALNEAITNVTTENAEILRGILRAYS